MKILVTGVAGFIGMHVAERLLARGDTVVGIDNLNDYYDVRLKEARLARLLGRPGFRCERLDIADAAAVAALFAREGCARVVHLAAQAGVRYSLQNPLAYAQSNLLGFVNILEGCRHGAVEHLVYASSSSVYGGNAKMPFAESDPVDHPVSLYAATKRSNELMAHAYSHLYGIPTTGLRFFTVYGPWGRPDMALFKFTKGILEGTPIDIYNHGQMYRDFTYVEDLVRAIRLLIDVPPPPPDQREQPIEGDTLSPAAPWRVVNIGNSSQVRLLDFVEAIEAELGKKAIRNYLPMQTGDVPATWADCTLLKRLTGYAPRTPFREGVARFVRWYREYHGA